MPRFPALILQLVGAGGILAGVLLHLAGQAAREEAAWVRAGARAEARAVSQSGGPTRAALAELLPEVAALRVRSAAWHDPRRHVRIDRGAGTLSLVEDGFVLRAVPVTVGDQPALVGVCDGDLAPGQASGAPACASWEATTPLPAGVRTVAGRVGRGIFYQPGIIERLEGAWPDREPIPPELSGAAVLSDGTIVYSVGNSPWALPPARAGTWALTDRELFTVLPAMEEGMAVYVW